MQAFDAYQALAAEQPNALSAPLTQEAPTAVPNDRPVPQPQAPAAPQRNLHDAAEATTGSSVRATPAAAALAGSSAERSAAIPPAPTLTGSSAEHSAASPPASTAEAGDVSPGKTRQLTQLLRRPTSAQLWSAGAFGLATLLALQLVFAYRSELAARYPPIKSVFTALCDRAGCSVTLPQRPDLVRIEASDVHMIDANRPQLIQLTATLRNHASYDLAYPALDLVLTNANEHALARRIFTPDEYLDQSRDPQAGIPANAEITVALDLDTGNLNASGFRLDLLAAPAP
jgi:hypothetical protein